MKVFTNERTENNDELPLRKGSVVPDGAVNLAWFKSPDLSPKNNLVVIDNSRAEGPSKTGTHLAYGNMLGILEDEYGNQAWPEEFPIIGDQFIGDDHSEAKNFLPYVHISRYFHLDYAGLGFEGSLSKLDRQPNVKVVDSNGLEYLDDNGNPKYEIFVVDVSVELSDDSRESAYRLWAFLDCDIQEDDLFLTYHKVEVDSDSSGIRNEEIGYKEPISAKEYYSYMPEESEVADHRSFDRNIYSTKPIDLKDQVIGKSKPSYKGWQIQVPKKAVPDPRKFELFRWRVACEYSRSIDPIESKNQNAPTKINAGVVTYNSIGPSQSRANYLFAQLNESSFNTGGIRFQNPLNENDYSSDQSKAAYWQVPIQDIALQDLARFDLLIWAPSSDLDFSAMPSVLQKMEYFVETLGGTFILESSSRSSFTGLENLGFSPALPSMLTGNANKVKVSTAEFYTDAEPISDSNNLGSWESWPPRLEDQFTGNVKSSHLLQNLNFLGGWDIDSASENKVTAYKNASNVNSLYFQYISQIDELDWDIIIDAEHDSTSERYPVLARKKHSSGGGLIVSTGCFFEDHIMSSSNELLSSSYQVESLDELPPGMRENFFIAADSTNMEGEMKLRINLAMLSTAFRPSPNLTDSEELGYGSDAERHSITLYSDWKSSWVINAHNDVLSSEEKAEFNFALLPKSPDNPDPVWMRILDDKTVGEIMDKKVNEVRPDIKNFSDWKKRYIILISNQDVETYSYDLINEETIPAAWTYSFSPPFVVPADLGPHVIKEEFVAGTGFGDGKRVYPPKPYKVRSTASFVTNSSGPHSTEVTVKFTGTARKAYSIPPKTVVTVTPPPPYVSGWYGNKLLRWSTDQYTGLTPGQANSHHLGLSMPTGIKMWTDSHYYRGATNNWPYWGHSGAYSVNRPYGPKAKFIQQLLNQFIFWRFIGGPFLKEDGYYGWKTASRIRAFQSAHRAIYVDGIVDAETWSLLGYSLLRLGQMSAFRKANVYSDVGQWVKQAESYMLKQNMSSLSGRKGFFKQSWARNGPSRISETFLFSFDPNYSTSDINNKFQVFELWIKPAKNSSSRANDIVIDWLDVGNNLSLSRYKFSRASHGRIYKYARAGQYTKIPFSKRNANSIIFRATQSSAAGWGSARTFGIEDVAVVANSYIRNSSPPPSSGRKTTTIPGSTIIEDLQIEFTYKFNLKSGIPQNVPSIVKNGTLIDDVKITTVDGNHNSELDLYPSSITEIRLTDYEIEPSYKAASIFVTPTNSTVEGVSVNESFQLVYNNTVQDISAPSFIAGPKIGDGSIDYYVKPAGGEVEPFPRSYGWVSKDQGVLLLVDEHGKPFGFPVSAPTTASGAEATFTRLTMDSWDTDQTLLYGFYDALRQEWIENKAGEPDISYYDYVRRGVQNVYMAVQTTYEFDGQSNLPPSGDPVLRPFKIAMPVYGVKTRNESSIKLRNPSAELGHHDVWPILIGTGSFSKEYQISNELAASSTTLVKNYGGRSLIAHYMLREAERGPWSDLLGRPYKDIEDEKPRLISDNSLLVNHAPIASIQEPTLEASPSDPVTPFFTVYRRDTFNGDWEKVSLSDIEEYNLNKGIIVLKRPLPEQDNRLVKVSYISRDYTYHHKFGRFDGDYNNGPNENKKINLNPYIMKAVEGQVGHISATDKPLYVYIRPSFIVEKDTKEIVSAPQANGTICITDSSSIFDPQQANYDPLAYRLGVIFVTTLIDMSELNILDSRVRGGGLKHHLKLNELGREVSSYWDSPAGQPYSYRQGGFVIVRLPKEIAEDFASEDDLRAVIDRNMTAGVAYEIQDYAGEPITNFTGVSPKGSASQSRQLYVDGEPLLING